MSHLNAALLHEYLDRGAVDDNMVAVSRHVDECDVCTRLMHSVEAEREEASSILRAAVPLQRPMPLFETLAPRPKFETFDGGVPTDIALPSGSGQFKQSSIGLRGQAVMFAWAATIVLALGAGWFANVMYRAKAARDADIVASAPEQQVTNLTANAAAPGNGVNAPNTASTGNTENTASTAKTANTSAAKTANTRTAQTANTGASNKLSKKSSESDGRLADANGANGGVAAQSAAAPPPAVTAEKKAAAAVVVTGERSLQLPRSEASNRAIVTGAPGATSLLAYPAAWLRVSADSAARLVGGSLVVAEGAAVIDYAAGAVTTGGAQAILVRVRQVTASNDTVEIMQGPTPAVQMKSRAAARNNASVSADAPSRNNASVPADATVSGNPAAGRIDARFYQTRQWVDGRSVTVIGPNPRLLHSMKLQAFAATKVR